MPMLSVPESWATEEHPNRRGVDQAAKLKVSQMHLDWQHKGELFISASMGSWHLTSTGKRCNTLTGSRLRAGVNHGQYLTGYPQLQTTHPNPADQAGKAPVVQWTMVKSTGKPSRLTVSHFHKSTTASSTCLQ